MENEGIAEQRSTSLAEWLFTEGFFFLPITPGSPRTCAWQDTFIGIAVCTESTTSRVLLVFLQKHAQATLACLIASLIEDHSFESSTSSVFGPHSYSRISDDTVVLGNVWKSALKMGLERPEESELSPRSATKSASERSYRS